MEQHWFSNILGGQSLTMPFDEDLPDGDWMTDGVSVATLITRYRGACAASDEVIGALAMADTGAQETGNYTLSLGAVPRPRGHHAPRWTSRHPPGADRRFLRLVVHGAHPPRRTPERDQRT